MLGFELSAQFTDIREPCGLKLRALNPEAECERLNPKPGTHAAYTRRLECLSCERE